VVQFHLFHLSFLAKFVWGSLTCFEHDLQKCVVCARPGDGSEWTGQRVCSCPLSCVLAGARSSCIQNVECTRAHPSLQVTARSFFWKSERAARRQFFWTSKRAGRAFFFDNFNQRKQDVLNNWTADWKTLERRRGVKTQKEMKKTVPCSRQKFSWGSVVGVNYSIASTPAQDVRAMWPGLSSRHPKIGQTYTGARPIPIFRDRSILKIFRSTWHRSDSSTDEEMKVDTNLNLYQVPLDLHCTMPPDWLMLLLLLPKK